MPKSKRNKKPTKDVYQCSKLLVDLQTQLKKNCTRSLLHRTFERNFIGIGVLEGVVKARANRDGYYIVDWSDGTTSQMKGSTISSLIWKNLDKIKMI